MTMIEAAEIAQMSATEKTRVMEMLWRSMCQTPEKVDSPSWHKKVLARRLAKVELGEGEFLTLNQLKRRLTRRRA